MTTYTQVGNRIIGDTIICEARQIKKTSNSQKWEA